MRRGCGDQETYTRLRRKALQIAVDFANPHDRLSPICDLIWDELAPRGVSWVGFYLEDPDSPMEIGTENGALLLAARRDKPACSPIGMHGACGQALLEEVVRLVDDVALLGANYIACDPRDRSEIVLPIYRNGFRWGVLDVDSHEIGCFGNIDVQGLSAVLRAAELLKRDLPVRVDRLP